MDQADALRQLVRDGPTMTRRARSLVFTSGKGGVGTSNLALNLAIALAEAGQAVTLVDADLGLANLDLLCGLAPAHDLGDVLAEGRPIDRAIASGPSGVRLVAGAHGMRTVAEDLEGRAEALAASLDSLANGPDFLLIDVGSGLDRAAGPLARAADEVVIVATPEPTAVADAHAAIRKLRKALDGRPTRLRAVVNQARSRVEAADVLARLSGASREFLGAIVGPLGSVRFDPRVTRAVRLRRPFQTEFPRGAASRDVRVLARSLVAEQEARDRDRRPDRPARAGRLRAALAGRRRPSVRLE